MRIARQLFVILLSFALVAYCQGNSFDKVRYNGGTIATKVSPKDWDNTLTVTPDAITFRLKDGQVIQIDPKLVSGLSYGQEAHRRVGTMVALGILLAPLALFGLFHKTRLHFIGIEYTTADGQKAGLLLQGHKNNYRAMLMALRGVTGAPVAVSEEDRKYVPTGIEVVTAKPESEEQARKGELTGTCLLSSEPSGADLWVDGKFVGNTPAKLSLSTGKHSIRVSAPGYQDWEREIEMLSGSEVTLNAVLAKSD